MELLYLAERSSVRIKEVPINWTEIPGSKLCLAVDSINMAFDLMFLRLAYGSGLWKVKYQ